MDFDSSALLLLNLLTANEAGRQVVLLLGNNALLRGGPVFFTLMAIWFSKNDEDHQFKIISGLIISLIAVVISVSLQFMFTPHVRPFMDAALHIDIADIGDMGLHRLS